ncbi:MAG: hypothetical protein V1936_04135 [Patescibacteria group bacterium]
MLGPEPISPKSEKNVIRLSQGESDQLDGHTIKFIGLDGDVEGVLPFPRHRLWIEIDGERKLVVSGRKVKIDNKLSIRVSYKANDDLRTKDVVEISRVRKSRECFRAFFEELCRMSPC